MKAWSMVTVAIKVWLTLVVLLAIPEPPGARSDVLDSRVRIEMERLSADSLWKHVTVLGSDSLEGRGTGQPGGDAAARYLAAELERYGLRPAGPGGTYFQPIPMHGSVSLARGRLRVTGPGGDVLLRQGADYLLYTTGAKTFVPNPRRLVFVGYGIVAPEYDYNDYQDVDVEGAIVVFLTGEPPSDDGEFFDGSRSTVHSLAERKQLVAVSRGARASIMVPQRNHPSMAHWDRWVRMFSFEHVTLLYDVPRNLSLIMSWEASRSLFDGAPYDLEDVWRMDELGAVRSFELNTSASFRGRFRERDFRASNVLGLLEGRDPLLRDSYLIISAHYDHLGVGPAVDGDSVYNGVVDNAMGCAATLEIARVLASADEGPLRSVIFLFLTGEEKGLLGSRHYTGHPIVPLSQTIANINIDGLAVIDTFDDVIGVGADLSTLGDHLGRVATELGLSISPVPEVFLGTQPFFVSDQLSFARAGVPSILVMEGLSYSHIPPLDGLAKFVEWGEERYHTPFDDLSQPINAGAMLQHARIVFAVAASVADTYTPPQWIAGTRYIGERLRSLAEGR